MTNHRLDEGNAAPSGCDWLGSSGTVALTASLTSQSDNESIAFLMSQLRTGGLVAWCNSVVEEKTSKDTGNGNVFEKRATDYLTDQVSPEFWREYCDPDNCDVDMNWRTGIFRCEGEYQAFPFSGISALNGLFTDIVTKVELVGIHFRRSDIEKVCALVQPAVPIQNNKRKGRPFGSGSMDRADQPLLAEMKNLIDGGIAFSPNAAATSVAANAAGAGTVESRATRLAKKYRDSEFNTPE